MADAVVVRPSCPECGSRHVPAYKTATIEPDRLWVTHRRCAACGHTFKQVETALHLPHLGPTP